MNNCIKIGLVCCAVSQTGFSWFQPINDSEFTAPTVFSYENEDKWTDLQERILETTAQTVRIDIQGSGGDIGIGHRFIQAIDKAREDGKYIIMNIVGTTASMLALTVCHGDRVKGNALLIYHVAAAPFSGEPMYGKYDAVTSPMFPDEQQCIKDGMLTQQDINTMYEQRQEVWVRLGKHTEYHPDRRLWTNQMRISTHPI